MRGFRKVKSPLCVQQDARRFKHFAEHIPSETQQCKTTGHREARESPIQPDCDRPNATLLRWRGQDMPAFRKSRHACAMARALLPASGSSEIIGIPIPAALKTQPDLCPDLRELAPREWACGRASNSKYRGTKPATSRSRANAQQWEWPSKRFRRRIVLQRTTP